VIFRFVFGFTVRGFRGLGVFLGLEFGTSSSFVVGFLARGFRGAFALDGGLSLAGAAFDVETVQCSMENSSYNLKKPVLVFFVQYLLNYNVTE